MDEAQKAVMRAFRETVARLGENGLEVVISTSPVSYATIERIELVEVDQEEDTVGGRPVIMIIPKYWLPKNK